MSLIKTMEQFHSGNVNSAWKALPMASFFKHQPFSCLFSLSDFFLPAPLNENLTVAMAPMWMKEKS